MKKLLYFAYYFPPQGGAGVQRSLKFVRYLPDFGWRPSVVTARADYWMEDRSLLAEIDAETIVRRVSFPGARLLGRSPAGGARSGARIRLLRGLTRWVALPDAYVGWSAAARRAGEELLRAEAHDAILTTSSPDSAHLIGRALRRRFGLPWVADFRDPWTRRLSHAPPTAWHDRRHRALERSCLREADRIVVTCEEAREEMLARDPALRPEKVQVVWNGFDAGDFRAVLPGGARPAWIPAEGFDLLHAGQLNPERPCAPFLAGLRRYFDRHPEEEGRRRIGFVGGHYDHDREAVRRLGLTSSVAFFASCPHAESIAGLLSARALLLLEQDSERGRLVLPGKFWEYARARRPVLALVPRPGAAERWLRALGVGIWADPQDPERIAEGLELVWRMPPPAYPDGALAPFERRELTRLLASILDALTSPLAPSTAGPRN